MVIGERGTGLILAESSIFCWIWAILHELPPLYSQSYRPRPINTRFVQINNAAITRTGLVADGVEKW